MATTDAMATTDLENGRDEATPPRQVPFARAEICEEARAASARVLESGWLTTGPEVVAFERELAEWVHADHGVAVASCTAAIELALRALRLPPGAKVLTSTMTFCGAVHAIVHAGLVPVLADVDAMVVVHYAGFPAPVHELAEAAGLPLGRVVEDAAHALGTWVGSRPVGSLSAATCFSFYATKNLPVGEGGMLTTADQEVADYARRARLHGMSRDAWKRYLPGSAWRYSVALAGIPGLRPPARPGQGRHAWHLYVVQVEPEFGLGRDDLVAELGGQGVSCSVHFIPVHHFPYFQQLLGADLAGRHPGADAAFERVVSLPLYPGLALADADYVCERIASLCRARAVLR